MTRGSLFVLLSSALLSGCFVGAPEDESELAAKELALSVGLKPDHACGGKVVKFRPNGKAKKRTVFHMPDDNTWHKNNPCLRDLTEAARQQPTTAPIWDLIYSQTLYILSNPNVRLYQKGGAKKTLAQVTNKDGELQLSKFDRIVYWNEYKIAYDSMSQVDFGSWLVGFARTLLDEQHPSAHYQRSRCSAWPPWK
jgi:hypothetical protein